MESPSSTASSMKTGSIAEKSPTRRRKRIRPNQEDDAVIGAETRLLKRPKSRQGHTEGLNGNGSSSQSLDSLKDQKNIVKCQSCVSRFFLENDVDPHLQAHRQRQCGFLF